MEGEILVIGAACIGEYASDIPAFWGQMSGVRGSVGCVTDPSYTQCGGRSRHNSNHSGD